MADDHPKRTLEPGTIDRTRRNIGAIGKDEAEALSKKLGGEILQERSVPSTTPMPTRKSYATSPSVKASGLSSADIAAKSAALTATSNLSNKPSTTVNQIVTTPKKKTEDGLPELPAHDLKLIDKLMMSDEYSIKQSWGPLTFLFRLSPKNREKITKRFTNYTMQKHVEHMQVFITTLKSFMITAPDSYKVKIASDSDLKFKFLRTVGKWQLRDIKVIAIDFEHAQETTVAMLVPFTKAIYRQLLTVYYIGEQQVPALIKDVYNDLTAYPDADLKKLQQLAKQGITEWLYVHNQIIKGMYPLLMRMCTSQYEAFPQFFTDQIANILQFLNLTKFDLLLPEKKKKQEDPKAAAEKEKKKQEEQHVAGKKDELVNTGLKILEQLFPEAGFSHLDNHPDMYPYFQPLYNFGDGFNVLHPENGLQVTVVLLRIIEDLLQGCRNIDFNFGADEKLSALKDNINTAMSEWASYREDLFDKRYGDYLRNFVNQLYSQNDWDKSQYGKESLTNILWRTKYYFLPNFNFTQILLNKPNNDNPYKPLAARTDYMKTSLSLIVKRIDENAEGQKPVLGVMNPWERYQFDIPNTISKRLDVLLGAKRQTNTSATNANLIKYTLCIVSVLDWWINNPQSPAYTTNAMHIYRISEKDGGPAFSAPVRSDQNQLFAAAVKRAIAARQGGAK